MKRLNWFLLLALLALIAGGFQAAWAAENEEATPSSETAPPSGEDVDDEWLNTVWTQVDDMVKEEEFKLQETVTVAGVRGAEATDNILDKLYYKGGKRYPSQDKLKKAIDTLKESIARNPKADSVPKQTYFVGQCYEKLGQLGEARGYYTQLATEHAASTWGTKAQEKLSQLGR